MVISKEARYIVRCSPAAWGPGATGAPVEFENVRNSSEGGAATIDGLTSEWESVTPRSHRPSTDPTPASASASTGPGASTST